MLELSKKDTQRIEMMIRGLVVIGRSLSSASRPFYVAWLHRLAAFGDDVPLRIGRPLGVVDIPNEARLFAQWGEARECGDLDTCTFIESHLDSLGVSDDARAILGATSIAADLIAATVPTLECVGGVKGPHA